VSYLQLLLGEFQDKAESLAAPLNCREHSFYSPEFSWAVRHIVERLAQQGDHQMVALGINPLDKSRFVSENFNIFATPLLVVMRRMCIHW
jgi:hypothetical protein